MPWIMQLSIVLGQWVQEHYALAMVLMVVWFVSSMALVVRVLRAQYRRQMFMQGRKLWR